MPWGQQVWEQRRVPRGGGSVGRAGTAAPVLACPSPAPGHVCLSRVGCEWDFTRRVGLGRGYLRNPPSKGSAVRLPRISPISRQFSVLICKHPAALRNPPAPQPRRGPCDVSVAPAEAGLTRLPWER